MTKMMFESGYRDPRMIIGIIQDVLGEEVFVQQIYFSQDKCISTCNLNYAAEIIKVNGWYMIKLTEYCDEIRMLHDTIRINQTQEDETDNEDSIFFCQTS
jgi:hypothetical protein